MCIANCITKMQIHLSLDIVNVMQISSNYVNVISDICTGDIDPNLACEAAADAVDDSCLQLLNSANPTVCSGMCATQVSMVVTTCASIVSLYSNYLTSYVITKLCTCNDISSSCLYIRICDPA